MTGFRRSRARTLSATLAAIAATAMLALAGPASANDGSHSHSRGDDDPAGTIASYDDGTNKLVIDLAEGGSIAGTVTRWTWIDADADDNRSCGRHDEARKQGRKARRHGDRCERRRSGDHGWHYGPRGGEDDLVAGAVVEDAILVLKDGRAYFAKVDLD